jgi:hypothetical protein
VRDLHLRHTLTTLARDASAVFTDLVEAGQDIPYEIGEPGESFAFCQYRPLTARFVRDNAAELRELESFREASETMRRSELAGLYLEEAGITPPADSFERANLAVTYFLARLWDGCSDFELDADRFTSALEEIEECAEPEAGEVEAIVPLVGFRMDADRLDLAGAAIVRADTVDVPPEAARADAPTGADWEPTFLISARVALDADGGLGGAGERVARTFDRIVSTLRLYKAGGVGLGPHGWVRVAGDRWRRISTGARRPRTGGYALGAEDFAGVTDLARTINVHPKRLGRLRRPLLRFEAGLDRRGAIDALNDHLLGLRFMLEGEGPAGVGLPMRAAALAADSSERAEVKQVVEHAIALERELWSGEPPQTDGRSPAEVALRVEDLLRRILRRGISGELGSDLRVAADETLLADGFAVGEGAGSEGEWELGPDTDSEDLEDAEDTAAAFERFERDPEPQIAASRNTEPVDEELFEESLEQELEGSMDGHIARRPEPAPEQEEPMIETSADNETLIDAVGAEIEIEAEIEAVEEADEPSVWLAEVGGSETMEFPARSNHLEDLAKPPLDRSEVKARVEYLFPRTETNWTVGGKGPSRRSAATG